MLNIMHAKTCNKKKCLSQLSLKAFVLRFFQSSKLNCPFDIFLPLKLNALELFMDDIGDVNVVIVGVLAADVHLIISNKR